MTNPMRVTLPAGSYVVGDPAYNIPDDNWDEVLDNCGNFKHQCQSTWTRANGLPGSVVAFYTKFGDGEYSSGKRKFLVDSGTIGIIPLEHLDGKELDATTHLIKFSRPFECFEVNGVLVFGFLEINTNEGDNDSNFGDLDHDF
jgi:hypothetical protein